MNHSTEKKRVETEVNVRAFIPSILIGRIVGKKEVTINEMRRKYEAEITISDQVSHGKQLIHTFGTPTMLSKLWKEVFSKIFRHPDANNYLPDILGIEFLAADALVKLLNSENWWKRMAEKTKTRILIRSDCLTNSTERVIYIAVPNQHKTNVLSFASAVFFLSKQLEKHRTIALSFPGNKFYIVPENNIIIDKWTQSDQDTIYDYSKTYSFSNKYS